MISSSLWWVAFELEMSTDSFSGCWWIGSGVQWPGQTSLTHGPGILPMITTVFLWLIFFNKK